MHDPVDIDLGRHHASQDADEGMAEWMADRQIKEATIAQIALEVPAAWDWNSATHALTNASKVPYTAEEVLIEALDKAKRPVTLMPS